MQINSGKLDSEPVCKECNNILDGFTGANDEDGGPQDNDINVCAYCGVIGRYEKNCTDIVPLTAEELVDLRTNDPKIWNSLMQHKNVADMTRKKLQRGRFQEPDMTSGDNSIEIK